MLLPTKLLTPAIADYLSTLLNIIPRKENYPIALYAEMLRHHPKVAIAAELRALFLLSLIRPYSHPDENFQSEVLSSFTGMRGSWQAVQLKLMQFLPFGFSFAEVAFKTRQGQASLKDIRVLNQEYCHFESNKGELAGVRYRHPTKEILVRYDTGIHLVNQDYLIPGNNPYGIALCERAINYWQLHKIVMGCLAIASQRQATPLIVGKTETTSKSYLYGMDGQPLLDSTGQVITINKGESFRKDLLQIENSSVLVIDKLDEIMAIAQQTDGQFLRSVLYYLDSALLWCFLISPVVAGTSESGLGDSSLIEGHLEVLKTVGRAQMQIFGDTLVEQLVRPMLEFNHGKLDDYGCFPVPEDDNTNTIALLEAISNGVAKGTFSTEDIAIAERAKQLAGIGM